MTATEYPIVTNDGKMICMCARDDNGNIIIKGKQGSLTLPEFEKQVLFPEVYRKTRGKRKK